MTSSIDHEGIKEIDQYVVPKKKVQSRDLKSGRLLGRGSSSIVYETTWEGECYARKDFLRVPSDIFEGEAAVLVGLIHPNVVRTYCWAVDEGSCSLVLELMDDDLLNMIQKRKDLHRKQFPSSGPSDPSQTSHLIDLHKFIEDAKNTPVGTASTSVASPPVYPFNMRETLQIMLQIAQGMKFLHDKGVVHGDLKPKNILVSPSGRVVSGSLDQDLAFNVKVADFGLAGTKMKSRTLVSRQTRKLEMVRWLAPELFDLSFLREDEHASSTDSDWDSDASDKIIGVRVHKFIGNNLQLELERADVYNFALTCTQILTGIDLYPGMGLNALLTRIPLGLRPGLPPTCPPQLCSLIKNCWGEKAERPSFNGILSELKDLQASLMADSLVERAELLLKTEDFTVSSQFGERQESSSNSLPDSEIFEIIDIPIQYEEPVIEVIQADSSKETSTFVLKQPRRRRKTFNCMRIPGCITAKATSTREDKGIPTSTKRSSWLKRRAKRKKNPFVRRIQFSLEDIKKMTNNFHDDNVLEEEVSYKVYKGIEAKTGAMLAVKRAQVHFIQNPYMFKDKVDLLSQVRNKNLVKIVGFCSEQEEQMVVYEYLPNGTLADWLYGSKSHSCFDWNRRLLVALVVAKGLKYLHYYLNPSIIHENIKSGSILLDEKLNAKVASFRISEYWKHFIGESKAKTRGVYLAPEYDMPGIISTQSDIYSFGVVLLELFSGRSPIYQDGRIVDEVMIRYRRAGMEGVMEMLDLALVDTPINELATFVELALDCLKATPRERPNIQNVMMCLEDLLKPKAQ